MEVALLAMSVHPEPLSAWASLQAQKLQKRELRQQKDGNGEDVRMGSAPRNNQRKRRKGAHGDVEMADAEVCQVLC